MRKYITFHNVIWTLAIAAMLATGIWFIAMLPPDTYIDLSALGEALNQPRPQAGCMEAGFNEERCVYPDGLECVRASGGGVSCNWDEYNRRHGDHSPSQ